MVEAPPAPEAKPNWPLRVLGMFSSRKNGPTEAWRRHGNAPGRTFALHRRAAAPVALTFAMAP